jgi:hypothetical protein
LAPNTIELKRLAHAVSVSSEISFPIVILKEDEALEGEMGQLGRTTQVVGGVTGSSMVTGKPYMQ